MSSLIQCLNGGNPRRAVSADDVIDFSDLSRWDFIDRISGSNGEISFFEEDEEHVEGITFMRADGSLFNIKFEGDTDIDGIYQYTYCTPDTLEPIYFSMEMDPKELYKILSAPEGYDFFVNTFLSQERFDKIYTYGFPLLYEHDGNIDNDTVTGNEYAGKIVENDGQYSIHCDPRYMFLMFANLLYKDEAKAQGEMDIDFIPFFNVKEENDGAAKDSQGTDFEVAFYLKYEEPIKLDNGEVLYAYKYKKTPDSDEQTLYLESSPAGICADMKELKDYDFFVNEYLSDERIQRATAIRSLESFEQGNDFCGNGYVGFGSRIIGIKTDKSTQEALIEYLEKKGKGESARDSEDPEDPEDSEGFDYEKWE